MAKDKPHFKSVDNSETFPEQEERTLKFWKENKIFEKSIENRPEDNPWTFLDGPPFVTGLPHYGSLLSSMPKDLFARFWTMKGYRVRRVWGWDGHGLPIENKVEEKLGIKRKKDIENVVGVDKFIEECKKYVSEVSGEWEWYVDKIGRWVDFENAYKTWDKDYMESVMWVFKQMYEKEYIYKGLRVSLFCPHCSTPISNFEVAMDANENYKDLTEVANTYKYQLKGEESTYFLAWSTTPWNKIVTPALAVNPKLTYVKVKQNNEFYILAKPTLKILLNEPYKIVDEFQGKDLLGKEFIPHYDFYKIEKGKKAFIIIGGDFVDADEGTGIVTIAAYGEDDLKAMNENNIQIYLHLDEEGHLKKEVPKWGGMYYLKTNKLVNEDLAERGLMYKEDTHTHSIPHCWRCHTRLFHNPQNAWFVDVQKLKPKMKEHNKEINWFPKHFKTGRFANSMENAPDWNISRSRYWGSPVPVWECECGERFVPGSIKELEELSGEKIDDLHKPGIDKVKIKCTKCQKSANRVPEVLDSWIEAGSASYAERHFPFEGGTKLEDFFPPDFITEYTGQIRAWFYVLHVIASALHDSVAFKNVVVSGVILGTDGRKMSKNYKNYPDPKEMLEKYGGDALRLYLLGSPVMKGEDILISEEEYKNQLRNFLLPLKNIYNFFITYANIDSWSPSSNPSESKNILDKWILSRMNNSIKQITEEGYEKYDTTKVVSNALEFIMKDLSLWYVRRTRDRVGPSAPNGEDKNNAHQTLWTVLTTYTKVLAPLIPFVAEDMYKNLTNDESVHLTDYPEINEKLINTELEAEMTTARKIVEMAHAQRKEYEIKVRQSLATLTTTSPTPLSDETLRIISDEINVLSVTNEKSDKTTVKLDTKITPDLEKMGQARDIIRNIQKARKSLGTDLDELINVQLEDWPEKYESEIKQKALIKNLTNGEFDISRLK